MISHYKEQDADGVIELWNQRAVKIGYKEMNAVSFRNIITGNAYFSQDCTFVMRAEDQIVGFACGAIGDSLPLGETSGYITTVILSEAYDQAENYIRLLELLEQAFIKAGKTQSEILFFNPMRLSWYIKNTDHHEHNNAPGVFKSSKLYKELLNYGYLERTTECAMYLDLEKFKISDKALGKQLEAQKKNYEVVLFDQEKHQGLREMLQSLENPLWEEEIQKCTQEGIPVLIAAHNNKIVGFAGPIIREENGRGYFTGIGVVKEHEGHGLGTVLFFKLCEEEGKNGADYMSLFTGSENPALRLYEQAGFETVEEFAVMRKLLD